MTTWIDFTKAPEHDGHYPHDPTLEELRKAEAWRRAGQMEPVNGVQWVVMATSIMVNLVNMDWKPEGWSE